MLSWLLILVGFFTMIAFNVLAITSRKKDQTKTKRYQVLGIMGFVVMMIGGIFV